MATIDVEWHGYNQASRAILIEQNALIDAETRVLYPMLERLIRSA